MQEEFKIIKDFPNYSISNLGNIANIKTGRILKPSISNGYNVVLLRLNNRSIGKSVHRLIAETFIPNPLNKPFVDHIDNCRTNNDISNLRWCTQTENNHNQSLSIKNTSGIKGVSFHKRDQLYRARICFNNIEIHIGSFDTLEEAQEARIKKANELFGEFTNKLEKIKTELEELQELEKELENILK
jgi:hypothetical protein